MHPRLRQILIVCCGVATWAMLEIPFFQNRLSSAGIPNQSPLPSLIIDQTYPPQSASPLVDMLFEVPNDPDWRTNWILDVTEGRKSFTTKTIDSTFQNDRSFSDGGRWLETKISNAIIVTAWDWATIHEGESVALPFSEKSGRRMPGASWQPNGNHSALMLSENDKPCCVWIMDQSTGRQVASIPVLNWMSVLAYSPDGRWLAISDGNTVTRYDTSTYRQAAVYKHKRNEVIHLRFSPNSQWLLTADVDLVPLDDTYGFEGNYHLWQIASGIHQAELLNKPTVIADNDVIFSPDGTMVLLRTQGTLRKIATQTTLLSNLTKPDRENFFAFSPNGRLFARADNICSCISVWDTGNGKQISLLKTSIAINLMVFSPNNQTLAIGGIAQNKRSHATELWNTLNGKRLYELDFYVIDFGIVPSNGPTDWLTSQILHIEWSPWGKWLLSVGGEGRIWVWDAMAGQQRLMIDYFDGATRPNYTTDLTVGFAPQGTAIIAKAPNQPIKIYYSE